MRSGELLTDDYLTSEADARGAIYGTKQAVLNYETPDKNFFSCSVAGEELTERAPNIADFSCVGCFTHHNMPVLIYDGGISTSYY